MNEKLKGLRRFESDFNLARRIDFLFLDWERSYPHVDLKSQLQWAHSWLESNPKRVKKDYARFLNNWMKNEERRFQERRQVPMTIHPKYEEKKPEGELFEAQDWVKLKEAIRKPI